MHCTGLGLHQEARAALTCKAIGVVVSKINNSSNGCRYSAKSGSTGQDECNTDPSFQSGVVFVE